MPKLIPQDKIDQIKKLRSLGWSLPEIYREVKVGYGSVMRYIKDVQILPQYQKALENKKKGSIIIGCILKGAVYEKAVIRPRDGNTF